MKFEKTQQSTGSEEITSHLVTCPFDRFEVKVKLGPSNEFLGVASVAVSKDFLSFKQRLSRPKLIDIDALYEEE